MARRRRYSEQRQPDTYKVAEYEQYRRDNQPDTYRVGDYEQRRQAGEFNRRLPSIEEVHRKWDEQKARREAAETAGRQAIYDTLNRNRVNGAVANAPEAVKKTVTLDDLVKKPAEEQKQAPEMNTAMGENGPRQPFSAAAKQLQDRIDRDRQKVTKEGVTSFSSWVGSLGKDYKKGDRNVTPKNVTSYLTKREAQVQGGQFSTSRDARLHSNAQQKQDYVAAQNEAEQARKEQLQMRQWRNENLPQTEEEKQALRERSEELNAKPGTWLDVNGLNVGNINDLENIRKRPDNYFDNREEYDEFLYDWMNGNGAYNERIESIETDHEVDVLEEELDRMWDRLESGDMHLYDEENTAGQEELKRNRILLEDADYGMSKRVEQADKYVDELKEETERDAMLEQMAEQAPAAKPFDVSMNPRVLGPYQIEGDSADRAFYEVNNSWWDLDARGAAYGPQPERQDWKDEWFMSDEPMPQYNGRSEKDIFNGYYRAGRKDEAMAFLEGLRPDLKYRRAKAQEYANRETARLEVGGVNIGGAIGVGASLAKPFAGVIESVDVLGSLFGIKGSGDMASQWHQLGNVIRDARDERGEVWDEAMTGWFGQDAAGWGKKFNGAVYSILDNAVAMGGARALTAGIAPEKALKTLTGTVQFIMSNGAAADDFAQRIDKGMDPDEAAVYAVSQGIIEAITEKYSVEALFKDDPTEIMNHIGRFLGKNFLTEGSEEVASDLLSRFTDDILSTVYGHESEFKERYRELQEDHNDQDAMRIAWGEVFQQFGESFLFGGLSGFVMSGGRVVGNTFNARQAGQNIQSVDSIMENGGTQQVISAGEAMGEGSQSAKLAAELKQKAESGKRIRTGKLGRLAQNIQIESQVKAEETANKTVEDKVQAAMVDNGVDPAQAKQLAAAAREGVMNGLDSLSRGQRQAIESTEGAVEAIRKVQNDAEVAKQVRENTAKYQSAAETATNLSEGRTAEGIDPETVGQHLANEEDIRNATGDRTGGVREVIVNHEYATLDGMEQDGDGNWKYKVTSNGKTSLLDASDIKATNFSAAAVIRENAVNPKFYSGAYTNELLNQIDRGNVQNVARYLTDAYKVRWAAYLGQEMPQTQLAENEAKELYRVSMTDAAEARKAQAAERPANYRGAGKGTATFNGTEYGTEAFDKAIGDVDSETRARIDYVANLAKASGIELNLIDTAAEDYDAAVHGWENGSGIVLNLDSYDSRAAKEAGRKHHIVATMSHEMTHWLQRNNASGYLRLQSFVLDNMAREGVDVAARAESLMAQRDISMTEAIDEIVANACDQVLGNEAIANRLKETDGKLYSAIKGFVQELVKKIRSAVVGMEDSASRDARKLMYKYGNELAKIWTGVYDEVLKGKISEMDAADVKKMSVAELDAEYEKAVESGDWQKAEQMLLAKYEKQADKGLIGYRAGYNYAGEHADIARLIKSGNKEIVQAVAEDMALRVPENAVLVPMPPHSGKVTESTDTMILARAISEITGSPVINALESEEHISRNQAKKQGIRGVDAKSLGIRQVAEIPEGAMPVFIDNVVGGGVTAKAAHDAMGRGITLAYAQSPRGKISGAKNLIVTYDNNGKLIPLSQRMDPNVNSWKYSVAEIENMSTKELDDAYEQAIKSGDTDMQQVYVKVAAKKAGAIANKRGWPITLYHGTRRFGFTEFDTSRTKFNTGGIFTTSSRSVAAGYSDFGNDRGASSKYIEDDGTDKTIIKNAKNVLGQNWRRITAKDVTELHNKLLDQFRPLAEIERKAVELDKGFTAPEEIENEFWNVVGAFDYIVNEDQYYFDSDSKWAAEYAERNPIQNYYEQWQKVREYYTNNDEEYQRLKEEGSPYYQILLNNYDHSDALVDLNYIYKRIVNPKDMFIQDGKQNVMSRETLQKEIESWKGQGNYSLYGFAGDKVLDIDAEKSFWTGIKAPMIGEGYFSTDSIVKWAKNNGYTSVIIRNVMDPAVVNEYGDDYVFFKSNQLKSADPIVFDDAGNIIPLSKRFNLSEPDIRYSMAEDQMDVNAWMMAQTPGKFQTENERKLLQAYRDMRVKISLSLLRQTEYTKQIRALEEKQNAGTLTGEERDQLINLRNRLEIQESKQGRLEQELYEVTSSSGYAGMMYKHSRLLADQVEGKTQAQVEAAVDSMKNIAEKTAKQIQKRQKELEVLAENNGVKTIQAALKDRGLNRTVEALQTEFVTAMPANELRGRLAEIILKEVNGENITEDINDLAEDVVRRQTAREAEDATEALKMLRGRTIVIGPQQQAELKGRNSNLNEIRRRTRGSGVKFEYGDHSTLESDWMEMQSEALSVNLSNSGDSLENIVGYIEGLLDMQVSDKNEWGVDIDEVRAFLRASVGIVLNDQTGGMSKEKLAEKIRKKEGALDKALAATKETAKTAEQLLAGARKAAGWASFLRRDVQAAIDYYNETAKQAAQVERQEVRKNLIEVLQNEHTRDLIKQSEEYEERIKRDRKARELRDDNESLRKQITTTVKRMKTLLTAETDTKNIQEEAKPLARIVTEMLVRHDMSGFRKVLFSDRKALGDAAMRLDKMNQAYGEVKPERDLDWLVIHGQTEADNDYSLQDKVMQDLMDIEQGLLEYRTAEGQGNITLQDRKNGLEKVQKAISEIYSVIKARGELFIEGKRVQVLDLAEQMREDFSNSRYKGDRRLTSGFWKSIGYGNLTPEYFFKNLRNRAMSLLHRGLQSAENRSGLEAYKARERVKQIAEETGFATWDPKEKHQVKVSGGKTVEMTTEQVMSLYATWMREKNQLRPEATAHLLRGGFVLAQNGQDQKLLERVKESSRPVRMTYNLLNELGSYLTENQRKYVDAMVQYMSTDLAELGNEASLQTYGIKKFTEKYYFPIKSWGGVLNKRSDSGVMNKNDNRAMRQSFSKRVQANASNAIEISDFTPTVVKHIVGMINFNTVGPAVENMRKVLNQQLEYGERNEEEDNTYRRNMEAAFTEAYGKNAADYLAQFMQDINGGVSRRKETSLRERLLSVFKKNAVAGSLSVAAQQPLSYIRAAMMINPKYLAAGLSPAYWKGSYKEMLTHSGVAVIKEMGKFDMNYGRSMQDYIAPDTKESKAKAAVNWISEKSTALPEKMDAMTWTRMWSACKAELKAQNPGMNVKSEEFLNKVAERFNEVMRRTQVYDSVMVKSQNMRSDSYLKKVTTSFMAEPTLSLNVLADAWQNIKEKGGKANAAKALATFLLSAAAQAGAKAFFGAGRSPDKKKNRKENWANKFTQNLLSELNVLGLIPGYSQVMDVLINGELNDDAMGVIGKGVEVVDRIFALATGKEGKGLYRDLEDSIGQMIQFATRVPAKNIMRDFRAMVNWFSNGTAAWTGTEMAQRETSNAVLKYQALDALMSTDLIGLVNGRLGEAGYGTAADDYAQRIYDAEKNKDKKRTEELRDYYINTKTSAEDPEKSLNNKLKTMVKEDAGLKYIDKIHQLRERGMKDEDIASWITKEYKEGRIEKDEAQDLYMAANSEKKQDDAFFHFAQAEWEKETGRDMNESKYFRLDDALAGDSEEDIKAAIKELTEHGVKEEDVNDRIKNQILKPYKEGNRSREETEKWLKKYRKDLKDNDIFWTLDRIDYKNETGTQDSVSGYYYRLKDALDANKAEDIKKAVSTLLKHGITKDKIKSELSRELKSKYLAAGSSERVKIKDAMQKAYKAAGYTATDADKIISGWLKDSKKKTNNTLVPQATKKPAENTAKSMPKRPASEKDWDKYMDQLDEYWQDYDFLKNDPVGRYGKGTIDMNSRKVIRNADGSISTEKSFSFYDGDTKKEILIPLIVNGKELTKQKAIDHYYETAKAGKPEYLGMFDDWKDADEYAMMLHNRGAWYYRNK